MSCVARANPCHVFFYQIKKVVYFSPLVDSVIKKQAIIWTLLPPTTSGLKFLFYFILFYFYFYIIIYSLLRYKKSHGALAMAKTKPKIQKELTKETSGTTLFNWGPYQSQAHRRA